MPRVASAYSLTLEIGENRLRDSGNEAVLTFNSAERDSNTEKKKGKK